MSRKDRKGKVKYLMVIFTIPLMLAVIAIALNLAGLDSLMQTILTGFAWAAGQAVAYFFFDIKDIEKVKLRYLVLVFLLLCPVFFLELYFNYKCKFLEWIWVKDHEDKMEINYQNYA